METNYSTKQLLLDISSMRSHAIDLLDRGKEYNSLLKVITEKDYYYGDDIALPTVNDLVQSTGITYPKVRKYLREIYYDLVFDEESKPFNFNEIEFSFYIKGICKNSIRFTAKSLPVVPRVGENISIPYFKSHLDVDNFYVEKVQHYFEDNKQRVGIWLKVGSYNLYWHFRKDQAEEEGELQILDIINLDETDLKRKLKIVR